MTPEFSSPMNSPSSWARHLQNLLHIYGFQMGTTMSFLILSRGNNRRQGAGWNQAFLGYEDRFKHVFVVMKDLFVDLNNNWGAGRWIDMDLASNWISILKKHFWTPPNCHAKAMVSPDSQPYIDHIGGWRLVQGSVLYQPGALFLPNLGFPMVLVICTNSWRKCCLICRRFRNKKEIFLKKTWFRVNQV